MLNHRQKELTPRYANTLVVGIVARISGCQNQKELSLEDQIDHAKEVAREYYPEGKIDYRIIATTGKGERLDRPELEEIEELLRSRELDLLIFEDVGRLVRGHAACTICGVAVDHGTRIISPNDSIDTWVDSWEGKVMAACNEHMQHNHHTSRRLKQKLKNRFLKFGGATPNPVLGYIKPPGAKIYGDWLKDETIEPFIREGFRILQRTLNGESVAEYWNNNQVPTGPYCRNKEWDGRMVLRYFRNPILKGMPQRGEKHTIKHNETGRRIAVRNPDGPQYREEPHLAYFSVDEIDIVLETIAEKNAHFRRNPDSRGRDPRHRVPKKRTRAYGQHATCYYCGSHYVWGGNGVTDSLMCVNSRRWRCWNSFGINGLLAAQKTLQVILESLNQLDGIEGKFQEIVQRAKSEGAGGLVEREKRLQQIDAELIRKRQYLVQVLSTGVKLPESVLKELSQEVHTLETRLKEERHLLERIQSQKLDVPETVSHWQHLLQSQLDGIDLNSYAFGDLIRELVPEVIVYAVRLCDGGIPLPRARLRLNLAGSIPEANLVPGLFELMSRTVTIDLFELPQRELIRRDVVQLTQAGISQRKMIELLPIPVAQATISKSLQLHQKMEQLGLTSPYVILQEPPDDYPKVRRHKNSKYRFEQKPGYVPPQL